MAYFDKKSGQIILDIEDKEMFNEIKSNFDPKGGIKTPISNRIIKSILPDELQKK